MPEAVRLVIWDLDETFWQGTLTEGSISHIAETENIVRELARRGILSSICSRNDHDGVKAVLSSRAMWDYFIFPSINWEPKGPRVRDIVEAAQLRPSTVLFIDDNPSNLEEARHFSPELQVAGQDIISHLLDHPLFVGKADPDLNRLRQYQALQLRKLDEANAKEDVETFLKQSDIRVEISYELSGDLDRIIELINRTNQLNFTKRRLPEDPEAARRQLSELLQAHDIQAGLLRVRDRYGDHGAAGFYLLRNGSELVHFCFSCRILGMGIESWLYQRLGRPKLIVSGPVLSDPVNDARQISWVHLGLAASSKSALPASSFDWVAARGGCDLQALSHYFRTDTAQVSGEFNVGRNGFDARVDHSVFLRYAVQGLAEEAIQEAARLGYRAEDFRTLLTQKNSGNGLIILSFLSDVSYALYRHRRLGFAVPFALSGRSDHRADARSARMDELPEEFRRGLVPQALAALQADYDYLGPISEEHFKENMGIILRALPPQAPVVLLQGNTRLREQKDGITHTSAAMLQMNQWLGNVVPLHPRAVVVDIRDAIGSEAEVQDWTHFDRIVYYRLYKRICELVS